MLASQGPAFNAEGVLIWEPLYLLFGLMLTTVYLEKMERGGLFDKVRCESKEELQGYEFPPTPL